MPGDSMTDHLTVNGDGVVRVSGLIRWAGIGVMAGVIALVTAAIEQRVATARLEERLGSRQVSVSELRAEMLSRTSDRYTARDAERDQASWGRQLMYLENRVERLETRRNDSH